MTQPKKRTRQPAYISHKTFSSEVMPLLMERFDRVDQDNTAIQQAFDKHVQEDLVVHKVVEQHKTYWGIAIKSLLGLITGAFAVFLVWLELR